MKREIAMEPAKSQTIVLSDFTGPQEEEERASVQKQ